MKNILLLIIFLTPYFIIYGQNVQINRTIEWENISTDNNSMKNRETLFFSNAFYDEDYLPVYSETINLQKLGINSNNVAVRIVAPLYENTNLEVKKNLNRGIDISSSVFYGRDIPYLSIKFLPFVKNNGQIKKLTSFTLEITELSSKKNGKSKSFASNSVLSTGKWVKIGIPERGVYKITYSELETLGFSSPSGRYCGC